MHELAVEVKNIYKKFDGNTIIDNLSFAVPKGSIFGFLGPNGAGKTTTIRMLFGLIRADSGSIRIQNRDIREERENILKDSGALIETPSYYGNLTAWENLKIVCKMKNVALDEIDVLLKTVQLHHCANKPLKKFSLGMKQRLGIAMALAGSPKFVALDEPMNGLDPEGIHEIRRLIQNLNQEKGITFLISSHLLDETERFADVAGIIKEGRMIYQGSLNDLTNQKKHTLEDAYLELLSHSLEKRK